MDDAIPTTLDVLAPTPSPTLTVVPGYRGDRPFDRSASRHAPPSGGFDHPVPLPAARGPLTEVLLDVLRHDPSRSVDLRRLSWTGTDADAATDDDLQLALWLVYEQHYRGLAGVDADWEWHPELTWARRRWEQHFVAGLQHHVAAPTPTPIGRAAVLAELEALASVETGPSLSKYLMREATSRQFAEFLVHRSLYHLKEADPHSWAIPRLSGSVKAALVTIQADEYGGGVTAVMHAQLFRALLRDWDLHERYGHYLDHVPGLTLMATNLISLFGLHRRWRGALVGHLTAFEMTSSIPNARYARGHRRLGGDEEAALFFDEHVVADSVHDQIALHDLAGGLVRDEPGLAGDVVFGARCAAYADGELARHLLTSWGAGASSLRRPLGPDAPA